MSVRAYRTVTEMEFYRERLLRLTDDNDVTDRILFYFKSLAGQEDRDFDEDVEHLFSTILLMDEDIFGDGFPTILRGMMMR
jgi:hypothetical protein